MLWTMESSLHLFKKQKPAAKHGNRFISICELWNILYSEGIYFLNDLLSHFYGITGHSVRGLGFW